MINWSIADAEGYNLDAVFCKAAACRKSKEKLAFII